MSGAGEREIPSRMVFRDPLEIMLAEEARTCRGCISQHTETVWGTPITICTAKDDKGKRRNHGKRCKKYTNDTRKGNDGRQD